MDKPLCQLCGSRHYSRESHKFSGESEDVQEPEPRPPKEVKAEVVRDVQVLQDGLGEKREGTKISPSERSKAWRLKNAEKHKEYQKTYMREFMRKKRSKK